MGEKNDISNELRPTDATVDQSEEDYKEKCCINIRRAASFPSNGPGKFSLTSLRTHNTKLERLAVKN